MFSIQTLLPTREWETQKCLFALKLLLKWIALHTCRHVASNKDVEDILKSISTALGRSIFEWQTLMAGVPHDAVTQMCSYSQSFPCRLSCKGRKQSCSACYTLHTPKVPSARRKCMLKNCPIVLMRFLMHIGHDTWLWPLDVFQCIISLIHSSKHCVYINLGTEGVIQAYQEQQWAGDSGTKWLLHSETHANQACVYS